MLSDHQSSRRFNVSLFCDWIEKIFIWFCADGWFLILYFVNIKISIQ